MSNDQSPPVRKVIPYKKGGPRRSPFSDMALQFSGTALDIAIQQREQGEEATPEEIPAQGPPQDAPKPADNLPQEVEAVHVTEHAPPEIAQPSNTVNEQKSSALPAAVIRPEASQRKQLKRGVRLVPEKKRRSTALSEAQPQLQTFIDRWRPFLTETQISICTYIYNNSIAVGQDYCFTSTPKLMAAVSKTERQVKTVLNRLVDWGFIVKGETIVNAPREERGTYYKLLINKS